MTRDNWERNRVVSNAAKRILSKSRSPRHVVGRSAQHKYIRGMRRQLVEDTGCGADTASRHIGKAAWYRHHGMKLRP